MPINRKLALVIGGAVGVLTVGVVRARTTSDQPPVTPRATTAIPQPVIGLGRVEAGDGLSSVASEIGGVVTRVRVRSGDRVDSGAVLVQLADAPEQREAEATRQRLEVKARVAASLQTAITAAAIRSERAARARERLQKLAAAGNVSDDQLDSANVAVRLAETELVQARLQQATAAAEVNEASRQVAVAEARIAQRAIRAPFKAQVLRVDVRSGEAVDGTSKLLELAPVGPQVVRCEFDELVASRIAVGAAVSIRPLSGDVIWARGRITSTAPGYSRKSLFADVAGEPEDRRVRDVRVQLPDSTRLPFNARVECAMDAGVVADRGARP